MAVSVHKKSIESSFWGWFTMNLDGQTVGTEPIRFKIPKELVSENTNFERLFYSALHKSTCSENISGVECFLLISEEEIFCAF